MEYSKVLKEVYEILKNSEDKIQKKIPRLVKLEKNRLYRKSSFPVSKRQH